MSYQKMLDKVMESGKRLLVSKEALDSELKEDPDLAHDLHRRTQSESNPAGPQNKENYDDYVKQKISSISQHVKAAHKQPVPPVKANTSERAIESAQQASRLKSPSAQSKGFQVILTEKAAAQDRMEFKKKKSSKKIETAMPLKADSKKNFAAEPKAAVTRDQICLKDNSRRAIKPSKTPIDNRAKHPAPPKKNLTPQRSPNPSPKGKQLLSVQEEFYKHKKRHSTPKRFGEEDDPKYQETLDIYKKYDFLKSGQIKITHKTAKYLVGRIKPADCLIHLLDSLFLLMGENKQKLEPKIRFGEYKQSLGRVEDLNTSLNRVFLDIKDNPEKYAARAKIASQSLEKFYNESIFCDLVTLDYCKEILWVAQGLIRFFQKCHESSEVPDFGTLTPQTRASDLKSVQYDRIKQHSTTSNLSGEPLDDSKPDQSPLAHFSYAVDDDNPQSERKGGDPDDDSEYNLKATTSEAEADQRDFISFGRGEESHGNSIASNQDYDIGKVSDMHKQKVKEMLERMYKEKQEIDENEQGPEDGLEEDPAEDHSTSLPVPYNLSLSYGSQNGFRHSWGGDPDKEIKIDDVGHDKAYDQVMMNLAPAKQAAPQPDPIAQPAQKRNTPRSPQKDADWSRHPIFLAIQEAKQSFNMKSLLIIKNQQEVDRSTLLCVQALLALNSALTNAGPKQPEDWRELRQRLSTSNLDNLIFEAHKPHTLLAISRDTIKQIKLQLDEYDLAKQVEQNPLDYYVAKISNYLKKIMELYAFAKEEPKLYSEIYAWQLQ